MRFNRLDLNLLVALEVLLTECSTTKAAKRLCLSQPATSSVLSRLREHFRDPLLQPLGRGMVRTPRGDSLLEPLQKLLQQLHAIADVGVDFDPATAEQHFRVAATDYAVSTLLAPLANRIAAVAPGVTLEIVPPGADMDTALARREIDLVLAPRDYLVGDHRQQVLLRDDYVCVLWDRHPDIGNQILIEQYSTLPHVAVQFVSPRPSAAHDWFERKIGVERRVEVIAGNFSCLPEFLVGTRRIATMRRGMVQQFLRWYPLRMVPLPKPVPPVEEMMQWAAIVDGDAAHRWLREALAEVALRHAMQAPDDVAAVDAADMPTVSAPVRLPASSVQLGAMTSRCEDRALAA